jgi:hypothetical protein
MLEEMRRRMLRLKTMGWKQTTGARWTGSRALAGALAMGLLMAATARGQSQETVSSSQTATPKVNIATSKIGPQAPVTYDNRYEVYIGLTYMSYRAGQNLPKFMNFGGGIAQGTYWLNNHIGVGAQYRGQAGTTPVFAGADLYKISRPLVYMNMGLLGAEYRGPKNQYVAVNYHAYGGVSHGTFSDTRKPNEPFFYQVTGLYRDSTKPIAYLGGSIDYNLAKKVAIRLSPDLVLEHFGSDTRPFFALSLGGIYRFGKR